MLKGKKNKKQPISPRLTDLETNQAEPWNVSSQTRFAILLVHYTYLNRLYAGKQIYTEETMSGILLFNFIFRLHWPD